MPATPRFPRFLRLFEPAPHLPPATDPAEIQTGYAVWQKRVLISTIVGYAIYYFVRKNLSVAMPVMERDLHITKAQLGLFLTLHGVLYGVSKFANGFFADRSNARSFMVLGLVVSALLNLVFGGSSTVLVFGVVWMLNGWFQGMGFPPIARLMTHWFPPRQLATKMAIWNTSHSIGAGLILILCGYLVAVSWRLCFFIPAGIALACSLFIWFKLPDTPESVGLPELPGTAALDHPGKTDNFRQVLVKYVFKNKYIWLLGFANFFVYIVRYGMLDWGPTYLFEAKHIKLDVAGWMMAAFEFSGLAGMLLCGWMTDRIFGGRGIRACFFFMAMTVVSILLFWRVSGESRTLNTVFLCVSGFFIYGPQALVGIAAANLATKRAAASGSGMTGMFGYASTIYSGWGLGALVGRYKWDAGLCSIFIAAILGTILFALGWNAQAHGYESDEKPIS